MLRALIFDCDGVLVDSEPVHLSMFQKVLAEEGVTLTEEDYKASFLAMDDRGCFTAVLQHNERTVTREGLADLIRRKACYFEEAMSGRPPTFPGVVDFVRGAAMVYPLAIASGALRHEVEMAIDGLGLRECFRVLVAAEDVMKGKPDPEAYLAARDELSAMYVKGPPLRSEECLVIEDSRHGVEAAKSAGMFCLAVTNSYPAESLTRADRVVSSFAEFDLEQVAAELLPRD